MGRRGRLKIAWPWAVQVRVLPRVPLRAERFRAFLLLAGRELGPLGLCAVEGVPDGFGLQKVFEGIAIEQGRSLAMEVG